MGGRRRLRGKIQSMATLTQADNPFNPGIGTMPPVLAGRDEEIGVIARTLARITGPRERDGGRLRNGPRTPIKLVGSRGTGKETLLAYATQEAERRQALVIRCSFLKASDSLTSFIDKMMEEFEIKAHPYSTRNTYRQMLKGLLVKKPVLLLFDEAVHYDRDLLAYVLRENQILLGKGWPLAMILAGTPALDYYLCGVEAKFIYRAHQIYIHQLSDEAVRDALGKPFIERGCQIADDALELMAGWTDNYPYLVQLAGQAVWDAMVDAKRTDVDRELVQAAESAMQKKRNDYYGSLYADLDKAELLGYANHTVGIIEKAKQPLVVEQLRRRLEQAAGIDNKSSRAACEQMQDLNLLWIAENDDVGPAIPSFFSYLKARYAQGQN